MQDLTLNQRNISLSDHQTLPTKSTSSQLTGTGFAHEKKPINIVNISQNDKLIDVVTSDKKSLPQDIRSHFEANSSAFVDFANKKNAGFVKKIEKPEEEDLWDRALLFGEYPGGKIPVDIDRIVMSVPKKTESGDSKYIFPSQIISSVDDTPTKAKTKEENTQEVSSVIHDGIITLPRFVSKKQEHSVTKIDFEKRKDLPLKGMVVPMKPKQPVNITISQQVGLSESLQKKIIEGQMRNVFENAPTGIKESLEKMPAQDVLSLKDTNEVFVNQNSDYFWKRRLRDYMLKLRWQRKISFKNQGDIEPKDGETVSAFIQRVYSITSSV